MKRRRRKKECRMVQRVNRLNKGEKQQQTTIPTRNEGEWGR